MSSGRAARQEFLARELVDVLEDCGHDGISFLDVLDALSVAGLELLELDEGNAARVAYCVAVDRGELDA